MFYPSLLWTCWLTRSYKNYSVCWCLRQLWAQKKCGFITTVLYPYQRVFYPGYTCFLLGDMPGQVCQHEVRCHQTWDAVGILKPFRQLRIVLFHMSTNYPQKPIQDVKCYDMPESTTPHLSWCRTLSSCVLEGLSQGSSLCSCPCRGQAQFKGGNFSPEDLFMGSHFSSCVLLVIQRNNMKWFCG